MTNLTLLIAEAEENLFILFTKVIRDYFFI